MALSGQATNGDEPTSRSATTSHVHRPAAAESRDTGRVHPKVCVHHRSVYSMPKLRRYIAHQ